MATDTQIIRLRQLLGKGKPLSLATLKVGIDAKRLKSTGAASGCPVNRSLPLENTLASKPTRSSLIFSVGSQAASPTASSDVAAEDQSLARHRGTTEGLLTVHLKPYWGKPAVRNSTTTKNAAKTPQINKRNRLPLSALRCHRDRLFNTILASFLAVEGKRSSVAEARLAALKRLNGRRRGRGHVVGVRWRGSVGRWAIQRRFLRPGLGTEG